jgi:hypothetical protein
VIRLGNSLLIDIHYKELGLEEIWDARRVERLCSLMKVTQDELSSMMMFPHSDMEKCVKADCFPGPICLLLTLIENFTVGALVPDPVSDYVFFSHGNTKDT